MEMSKGKIFCFFGIDGAGKTTIIREIEKRLEKEGYPFETIYMGRAGNHKLPFLKSLMRFKSKRFLKKRKLNPSKINGPLVDIYRNRSFFWTIGYYIEMWLRYIEAKKISKKKIVLMDRYFYDGLILAKKGKKFLKYITPIPTKSFLITAPPEIILNRKQEAKKKDIINFYKEARDFTNFFNIKIVNNSLKLEKVVEEIYETIKEKIRT
jgi:thymidylate kinase